MNIISSKPYLGKHKRSTTSRLRWPGDARAISQTNIIRSSELFSAI